MWRRASVIALLKPGKLDTSPNSYRPISLLCTTFKLTEHLILNRINLIVEKFLPREQVEFRGGWSTVDQVACLTQNIEQALEDKNVGRAIFSRPYGSLRYCMASRSAAEFLESISMSTHG